MRTVRSLSPQDLIKCVENVLRPKDPSLLAEVIDEQLFTFCLNCPDPGGAMDLVVEAPIGSKAEDLVAQAMAMPARKIDTWSEEELAMDHPLRTWKLSR